MRRAKEVRWGVVSKMMMTTANFDEHRHAPAATLFCKPPVDFLHSGPAISLEARDSFTLHFVETFAAALTEARHPRRDGANDA